MAVTEDAPVYTLLEGQKAVFERIARGAPLPETLEQIVRLLEAHSPPGVRASILLLDQARGRLLHGAGPSLPDHYNAAIDGISIGPSVGSCGTAAFRGEPVIVEDIETDPLWAEFKDLALGCGLRACWSMPIRSGDRRVLGTFAIYRDAPKGPEPDDWSALSAFAQTAAVAIERHEDERALRREKRRAEVLYEVGRAISSRLQLEDIVQHATDAATELCGGGFGAFFYNVVDERGESYQLYTIAGAPREAFERFPMPRATSIFAPTFNGEGTVRLDDVTADPRYGRSEPYHGMPPGHLPVRSYLAVPVITSEREVVGGLFLGHAEAGVFDEEAARIAEGIASHAAIAIENARLYEERDRVARTLQQSLLPPALPAVEHLDLAARDRAGSGRLCGDFHDVFPLDRYRWGVLVGDVGGSGVQAAAATAYARYTLRTAALLERHPSGALYVLDQSLREEEGPIATCSAVFASVEADPGAATLVLTRGGYPRPLVVRATGVVEAPGAGPRLGGQPGARFDDVTIDLRSGDAIVLHGEGLPDGALQDALAGYHGRSAADIADAVVEASGPNVSVLVISVPAP